MQIRQLRLPFRVKKPVLALGSDTKNTLCFLRGKRAYISGVHPDLLRPHDLSAFEKEARYFLKKRPSLIAYDPHPEYQSAKYALGLRPDAWRLLPVQHHHAHIAACMVENGLVNQKVIGVAFDGTGLGADGSMWGAEFLLCDYRGFKRAAHLREIPLLGGEKAILQPWRLKAIWLYLAGLGCGRNNFIKGADKKKWLVLKKAYLSGFKFPLSSSMGRLFDAAASLILSKSNAGFEAELAMELERLAARAKNYSGAAKGYPFRVVKNKAGYILDPLPMFRALVLDLQHKQGRENLAYRFHLTVARMIEEICSKLKQESRINRVVLSGGVFQNKLLLGLSLDLLYRKGFSVFRHKELSCNDSGISLGQAVIAAESAN